ncbi:hypothetical protein ACFL04_01540 [Patescibacteria group bacterium]
MENKKSIFNILSISLVLALTVFVLGTIVLNKQGTDKLNVALAKSRAEAAALAEQLNTISNTNLIEVGNTNVGQNNNQGLIINTNTNSSVNINTSNSSNSTSVNINSIGPARECTVRNDCSTYCDNVSCPASTSTMFECLAGQCTCACIEYGPEDELPLTYFDGQVTIKCSISNDCTIVNKNLTDETCYRPLCEVQDYAQSEYVAVNLQSLQELQQSIDNCVSSACPGEYKNTNYIAQCIDSTCQKVLFNE